MRKAITETGMPMLTPEYKFRVYWDQGRWQIEAYREGVPFWDTRAATSVDAGYEIRLILEEATKC